MVPAEVKGVQGLPPWVGLKGSDLPESCPNAIVTMEPADMETAAGTHPHQFPDTESRNLAVGQRLLAEGRGVLYTHMGVPL